MSRNTIVLRSPFGQREEIVAASTIKPGELVEVITAGTAQSHSTEGGFGELAFAIEDALQGKTIDAVEGLYAIADPVAVHIAQSGDLIQAIIKAGETVVIGSKLVSAGDGSLKVDTNVSSGVTVRKVIGVATEAIDLSATAAVDTLSPLRIV